jgi:hypothetical protein
LKKLFTHTKRAGGVAQGESPEFKPQYHTQKKKFPISLVESDNILREKSKYRIM